MQYVITAPETLAATAADVARIGAAIDAASASAAGPISGLPAAAEDEVSAAVAKLFDVYGQEYRAAVRQAVAFQNEFTQALAAAGSAYAQAEAANAALVSWSVERTQRFDPGIDWTNTDGKRRIAGRHARVDHGRHRQPAA